jgi:hypothetical protein
MRISQKKCNDTFTTGHCQIWIWLFLLNPALPQCTYLSQFSAWKSKQPNNIWVINWKRCDVNKWSTPNANIWEEMQWHIYYWTLPNFRAEPCLAAMYLSLFSALYLSLFSALKSKQPNNMRQEREKNFWAAADMYLYPYSQSNNFVSLGFKIYPKL